MGLMLKIIFDFLFAFLLSFFIAIPIYKFLKKQKAGQPILEYVEKHAGKSGTPTMGGIIFLIAFLISSLILLRGYIEIIIYCLVFVLLNAMVGFYDDFLKIKGKKNLGLKPYQKLLFQIVIGAGFGGLLYAKGMTYIIIPFAFTSVNCGVWTIFISIFISIFLINSVNLTDGLDGLVSFITASVMCGIVAILGLILSCDFPLYQNFENFYSNFRELIFIFLGALLGFIYYNVYPAKMFMGDTGSLSIGAVLVAIGLSTGTIIYVLLFGVMYLVSSVSVIIQVAYYKLTKKRVLLMAPLHHHFELKSVHENRITFSYALVTIVVSLLVIMLELLI